MPTKYQVFVSSTYEDLRDERDQVIKAVLEMGHIPVGMEMFSAADEEQWKIIARHIDESDYYCVILAHRYGSVTDGISYTRKEYEYAIARGIPVLGFILDESASWPAERIDKVAAPVRRLNEFRALVKQKPISAWTSADDLYGKVSIALAKQMTANPRDGWVRGSSMAGPEVAAELTRLSAENARLRDSLAQAQRAAIADRSADIRAIWDRLRDLNTTLSYKYRQSDRDWEVADKSHASYFYSLGPSMMAEVSITDAGNSLAMDIREDRSKSWWTVAYNQVRSLFADWMALGLVEPSKRKHAVADKNEYWCLTEFGLEVLKFVRQRQMELRGNEASPPEDDALPPEPVSEMEPKAENKKP